MRFGRLIGGLLLGLALPSGSAGAAVSVDCATLSLVRLKVAVAPGSSALRTVEMQEGDTLTVTFSADKRATGTVALVAGPGEERQLLRGRSGATMLYTADQPGEAAFRLAARGGAQASFTATCVPRLAQGLDLSGEVAANAPASADPKGRKETAVPSPKTADMGVGLEWVGVKNSEAKTNADADTLGVKLKLQPSILVGFQAQFDPAGNPLLGPADLSDKSWLAGPITSVQLVPGLSLDARAAWGPADAGLSSLDRAAERQLLDARLAAKQTFGPWRFSPSAGLTYAQKKHGPVVVPQPAGVSGQQTVESGRIDVRPEMAYRIDMGHSMFIEPKIMVGAFWDLGTGAPSHSDLRHMAETGITLGNADGSQLLLGGRVEEGEALANDVWSGHLQLNIPLK